MWRLGITILHGVIWESLTYKITPEQRPEDEEMSHIDSRGRAVQAKRASNTKPLRELAWQIQGMPKCLVWLEQRDEGEIRSGDHRASGLNLIIKIIQSVQELGECLKGEKIRYQE